MSNLLFALAALLFIVVLFFIWKNDEHAYYLKINGLEYHNTVDTINIGGNDDVLFATKALPERFLQVCRSKNGYSWRLKQPAYVKLNNVTINKYPLSQGDVIQSKKYSIGFGELTKALSGYSGQQSYFSLCDILGEINPQLKTVLETDTLIKSLVHYDKDKETYDIIFLDSFTRVNTHGTIAKGEFSGNITGNSLKIEIIQVSNTTFISSSPLLNNNNINTPTVRTAWQSSHLLVGYDSIAGTQSVLYSQPLIVGFNRKIIQKVTGNNESSQLFLSQESNVMDQRTFYFEDFSSLFPLPFLTILKNDTTHQPEKIQFLSRSGGREEKSELKTVLLNKSAHFAVLSPENRNIAAICEFIYYSGPDLASPFLILTAIFLICTLLLFFLSNPDKYVYSKLSHKALAEIGTMDDDAHQGNKGFYYLRLPVLLTLYLLMTCKLIIATKLCFTHPYFPQLYFGACFMAFSTPVYIVYFWLRNSWSIELAVRYRFMKISVFPVMASIWLLGSIAAILFICWQLYGIPFYQMYFAVYDFDPGLKQFLVALKQYLFANGSAYLFKQKYLLIPVLITIIPLFFVMYDLLMKLSRIPRPNGPVVNLLYNYGDLFFLNAAFVLFRSYSFVHLILIYGIFRVFNSFGARKKFGYHLVTVMLLMATAIIPFVREDVGFIINYILPYAFAFVFLFLSYVSKKWLEHGRNIMQVKVFSALFIPVMLLLLILAYKWMFEPGIDDLSRTTRRITAIVQKDEALATGGKQYLSDIQFLQIARLNAMEDLVKPSLALADKEKHFHPFISKGLYPVIINDLNPLIIIEYGGVFILVVLLLMWLLIYLNRQRIWSGQFRIERYNFNYDEFRLTQLVRFIPVLIIISNSLWMLLSLYGFVFFTGRVVNGLGVESTVDWFDTILMAVLMGHMAFNHTKEEEING